MCKEQVKNSEIAHVQDTVSVHVRMEEPIICRPMSLVSKSAVKWGGEVPVRYKQANERAEEIIRKSTE